MDNDIIDNDLTENEFSVSNNSFMFLNETRKWASFIAIVGFIITGFMAIAALFMGSIMGMAFAQTGMPSGLITGIYIAMSAIYFFPCFYLYKFSSSMKGAIQFKDSKQLEVAFENLKSFFKFIGIFLIIVLGLYALMLLFGLAAGTLFGNFM